ncbi:MAG: twin-arginine translocation signal domain-containing protein [Ktedonobacteraceae bacterium]
MAKLTRRGFIGQTTASVATIGILATVPTLASTPEMTDAVTSDTAAVELSSTSFAEPLVAHVSDLASGEVTIMVGTREVILRDTDLVLRLLKAVH